MRSRLVLGPARCGESLSGRTRPRTGYRTSGRFAGRRGRGGVPRAREWRKSTSGNSPFAQKTTTAWESPNTANTQNNPPPVYGSVLMRSADAPAPGRPRLRIPVFPASQRGLIVDAVAITSGVGLRGSVQPGRRPLAGRTRRVDICLRDLDRPIRLRRSPRGELSGVLRSSRRRHLNNPHGHVLALPELFMRAVEVSLPDLSPRERRLLELSASGESFASIGRKPGMRRSPFERVDRPMLGEALAGERWVPRGPGLGSRRGAQRRGEDVGIPI